MAIPEEIKRKLAAIQEGSYVPEDDSTGELDCGDDDEFCDLDEFDEDMLEAVMIGIIQDEVGEKAPVFIQENAGMLIRDKILTEEAVAGAVGGKSYVILSPEARKKKYLNMLKIRMARDAADPIYKKAVVVRKLLASLLDKIRNNPKYKTKAEQIVRKMKFRFINNPEAMAALRKSQQTKLA